MNTPRYFKATISEIADDSITVTANGQEYAIPRDVETFGATARERGDRVLVERIESPEDTLIIRDSARDSWLMVLVMIFMLVVVMINRWHGLRSLVNLGVTLAMIFMVIIPLILAGWSPVGVTVLGGGLAMIWSIYFSNGINKKSHSAFIGILLSLLMVGLLAWLATTLTALSGFAEEEAGYLAVLRDQTIDMRGLLLAAITIGALGILDDLALSQVSVVHELRAANPNFSNRELFRAALRVGRDHISAVINTLVLAYAGASFPLVILLTLREPPFDSLLVVLNDELIATELVRTLVGSMGIVLAMPIVTWVALRFYARGRPRSP